MCGIVGIAGGRDDSILQIERMRETMVHRGPDSGGLWVSEDSSVIFGHRRLSIIDLSEGGHQPMVHAGTGCVITFNGEIYNFRELRNELSRSGHHFRSNSDTEVLLAAYVEWGPLFVDKLAGMFAFAIYDPRARHVLLARDIAGEKPCFYTVTPDGEFLFASELKALLAHKAVGRRVSLESLNEYFAYGYVAGSHTIFKDIFKLPAGHTLTYSLIDAGTAISEYWSLDEPYQEVGNEASLDELVDELQALLGAAVQRQLVADVPVGVLLSGGVDSGIVSALAARSNSSPVRTFTVRFPDTPKFDEGHYAALVAKHIGSQHIELTAHAPTSDLLRKLASQYDDPVCDSSMVPTYLVSAEIRKHATVAIGGDGGDELFGGYHRHSYQVLQNQLRQVIPRSLRVAASGMGRIPILPRAVRAGLGTLRYDLDELIARAGRIFPASERKTIIPGLLSLDEAALLAPEHTRMRKFSALGIVDRVTRLDFTTYMRDDVLVKVDRASMLASLEVRAPLLDRAVVEFAFRRVPPRFRATARSRKVILRALAKRLLPPELDTTRKQGFSIPTNDWFKGQWSSLLDEVSEGESIEQRMAIGTLRRRLDSGENVGERLFAIVLYRLWCERYRPTDYV